MESNKFEIAEIQKIEQQKLENELRELAEVQLSLIGGGIGEVIVA
jgi:hypothetical protein